MDKDKNKNLNENLERVEVETLNGETVVSLEELDEVSGGGLMDIVKFESGGGGDW